jgi:CheY-specific phosphatase CheX
MAGGAPIQGPLTARNLGELAVESASALSPVLGLVPCRVLAHLKSSPPGLAGMAVRLEGQKTLIIVGVLSNAAGRSQLVRALFQLDAHQEEPLPDEDDAIGELANLLAGRVKAATAATDRTMRLTPPEKITGEAFAQYARFSAIRVSFGAIPATLVIALPKGG